MSPQSHGDFMEKTLFSIIIHDDDDLGKLLTLSSEGLFEEISGLNILTLNCQ